MEYDVIVVGGGLSGLTSAAFLSKEGYKVLLCEKEKKVGGLVSTFDYKGFKLDSGIRAFENSGVLLPMLEDLGIEIEFLKNTVSVGIGDEIVKVKNKESLNEYKDMLIKIYPENKNDIEKIICEIEKIMGYMDILYGIDNPIFKDIPNDKEYVVKTLFPWMIKYLRTNPKIAKLNKPVDDYLRKFTDNNELIDIVVQHFFKKTPTFFALSYFSLYLDYRYPKGGTGTLTQELEVFINNNNGDINKSTEIVEINVDDRVIRDKNNNQYSYKKLIWAGNSKSMYNTINLNKINNKKIKNNIDKVKDSFKDKKGGDSVLTVYATVDIDINYFELVCTEHLFYTIKKEGINKLDVEKRFRDCIKNNISKEDMIILIKDYYDLTTYEISIPAMRDSELAPNHKSGLIISTLMDYTVVKYIKEQGWYEEFKDITAKYIISILDKSIFKGINKKVIDSFVATPLTIESKTFSHEGAITGWAFTNMEMPTENKMIRIMKSVNTVVPNIYQAGQWAFSPSGLPISMITGKIAADKCKKTIKK